VHRRWSVNNLKLIALAFHNYHSTHGHFPTPVLHHTASNRSIIPYSWRVAILPFIEQGELYKQYNFDEPWDGPNNRALLAKMPAAYGYPDSDGSPSSPTNTTYFVFTGESTALNPVSPTAPKDAAPFTPEPPKIADITDGTSNTILVVEARRDVPWTKPEDIPFSPNAPVPELGGFTPDGTDAAFADGAVRFISKKVNPIVLKALITRDGGEAISSDAF
jgi:hypothetical protein